jgi:Osmosensitive K+ channel His kinase sensor domain
MAEELDLDAALAPGAVALLDELARGNVPGSRHATRWQDAEELLQAGIDVVATAEVHQLDFPVRRGGEDHRRTARPHGARCLRPRRQ